MPKVLFFSIIQIRRCDDESCSPPSGNQQFKWMPFPASDPDNTGHYKQFSDFIGQEPTEKDIPSNVNNARKVSKLEQVSTVIVMKLESKEKRTLFCSIFILAYKVEHLRAEFTTHTLLCSM